MMKRITIERVLNGFITTETHVDKDLNEIDIKLVHRSEKELATRLVAYDWLKLDITLMGSESAICS